VTTAAERRHMALVRDLGCMITGRKDCILHHARGGSMSDNGIHCGTSQRPNNYFVIPLIPEMHNTSSEGIHLMGVESWEKKYKKQYVMLKNISEAVGYDVFEMAKST
jgi:hypothetical protein